MTDFECADGVHRQSFRMVQGACPADQSRRSLGEGGWVILSARAARRRHYINMRGFALALVIGSLVVTAVRWGTFVAGGSDSYCYVHQAERWASGQLQVVEPLALEAPWPDASASFTPIGHQPSRTVPGAIVPVCPSGLSILMATFLVLGGRDAIFLVVPLLGALLVGATYVLGSRYGTRVGVGAALLAAASPAFLYQLV